MVKLDDRLLYDARRITTSANANHVKEMTSAYEEAVHLHNRGYVSHEVYQRQHECQLRSYVLAEQLELRRRHDSRT